MGVCGRGVPSGVLPNGFEGHLMVNGACSRGKVTKRENVLVATKEEDGGRRRKRVTAKISGRAKNSVF